MPNFNVTLEEFAKAPYRLQRIILNFEFLI